MKIIRIHYFSATILTIFIAFHLFNHLMSIFGPEWHIEWMNKFRLVYRNPLVESMLLIAVIIQIITGLKLFRNKSNMQIPFVDKIQICSGLYLAFFLVIHVSAVMVGRFILKLDTNYYFGVAGLNSFPANLFFIPYYSLAMLSFFVHIAAIHCKKMRSTILGLSPKVQAMFIFLLGCIFILTTFYGLTNQFRGVEIPEAYRVLTGE